jgi:hypothetical protein
MTETFQPTKAKLRDNAWKGQPCAVLGGGPNLKTIDIDSVLDRCFTVGCNVAAKFEPDITYIVDEKCTRLVEEHGWLASPLRILWHGIAKKPRANDGWLYLPKLDTVWSNSVEHGIGKTGGCGLLAYEIAAALGGDPIFLIGFDCDTKGPRSGYHWHNHYPDDWCPPSSLNAFLKSFEAVVPERVRARTLVLEPSRLAACGYRTISAENLDAYLETLSTRRRKQHHCGLRGA